MKGENFLDREEQRLVRQGLRRGAPCIETEYEMFSRKIEGLIVPGREEFAYEKVHVFVQKGLAVYKSVFFQVLRVVSAFQYSSERGKYLMVVYTFGGKDARLHRKEAITVYYHPHVTNLSNFLAEVSGTEPPGNALIAGFGQARGNDLQIFFCANREVCVTEEAMKRYRGAIRQKSLWIFVECDKVGWEFGTFIPQQR